MNNPTIFISYSHKDEKWKDRLINHLGVLQNDGQLNVWDDRRIVAGSNWEPEIEAALQQACAAVLLISDHFLTSQFILGKEVPLLLQRREAEGLPVIPVIISSCPWAKVSWLNVIQSRPKDGKALASFTGDKRNQELSKIAIEISELLKSPKTANLQSAIRNPQSAISISRLPNMLTNDLFGRKTEVQMLNDAWDNPHTNVIVFTAFGGSGKSALIHHWVQEMATENWRGAARIYAWSFWSQGSDQPQTSADPFIDAALRWFGDTDPTAGSPWDKGERLARLIKQSRTLLILDGLEPLQHPKHTMEGRLKEQSMQALLKELAAGQPGLCVVSTREHVADLQGFRAPAVIAHDLEQLSPEAGASILRQQQIKGSDAELQQASSEFGNHALALTILASFLHNAYDGDIRKRKEIGPLTESLEHGGHARRVMTSYETWLRDAGEDTLLAVLRVLGLFNRPADAASLAALREAPAIPDLTEALLPLSEPQWKQLLAKLRRLKLLTDSSTNDEVDAHPLLREHFRDQLQRAHPAAWQAGNLRLYEHLTQISQKTADKVEKRRLLYTGVAHGCAAGDYKNALEDYRIGLGWNEIEHTQKIGATDADWAALQPFFDNTRQNPVPALKDYLDKEYVLSVGGLCLRALGRLKEALPLIHKAKEEGIVQKDWTRSASRAGILSELYLTLGNLSQAIHCAKESISLAALSKGRFQLISAHANLADALHYSGQLAAAEKEFYKAKSLQKKWQTKQPILYSLQGVQYCEFLLSKGETQEARAHAMKTLEWVTELDWRIDIALDNLSLGRVCLLEAQNAARNAALQEAEAHLNRAVGGLRQGGKIQELSRALLARAAWARVAGDYDRAQRDLVEAFTIAERGEMRLHLCDAHLEAARLHLAQDHRDEAHSHWTAASKLIAETGYLRRKAEADELARQLSAAA